MRSKIVKNIFKKEMLDIIRDKKTLFMMMVLPIVLYPILMIVFSQVMMMSANSINEKNIPIAIDKSADSKLINMIKEYESEDDKESGKLKIVKVKDYKKAINDEKIGAYIDIEEKNQKYNIYTNSSNTDSSIAIDRVESVLNKYKEEKVNQNLKEKGLDVQKTLEPITYGSIDIAKNEEVAGHILGQMLPCILMVGILLGTTYPAIDVMAGEKERGTLETLLTLPISNLELVMGKYMAVSFSAITTAIFNVLSIVLTLVYLLTSTQITTGELGIQNMDFSKLAFPLIITLVCVCLFAMVVSAISMCVCSLAKSFKDAQNYITPVTLIVMIPSYASIIPNIDLNRVTATIPVVNISLLIKSVLSFKGDLQLISLVLISNIAFVIISVYILSKMFNSEEILFGNSSNFSFLEKRSNIKKGNMPTPSDGMILYAISIVLFIYVGTIIQMKFGFAGIALTQIMLITLPILFTFYIKSEFREIFSIKLPKIRHIIGGIILLVGGFIIVSILSQILLYLFPQNMKTVEGLNKVLYQKNIWINILVVALMPAVCEEILFRGFIFKSFNKNGNYKMAIIGSAILFGIMHMDFIRIIPAGILGIILAYSLYKTKSIFIPMMIHFINNLVAVISIHYSNTVTKDTSKDLVMQLTELGIENIPTFIAMTIIFFILISIICIFIGSRLLSNKDYENKKIKTIS